MPRISLWKPQKGKDYYFSDRALKDYMFQGGTGVFLHKYTGPASGGDETTIDDVLFLENRSRKYDDNIYELRGTYQPQSSEFDLSQFGIFISNDTITIFFHYNDMLDIIGRKIMSGDVLELPHLEDPDTLNEDSPTTHRFYVVEECVHAAEAFGNQWWSHVWRVRCKKMAASQEFSTIFSAKQLEEMIDIPEFNMSGTVIDADGNVVEDICCDDQNSNTGVLQDITDGIITEAYSNVRFDPKQFDAAHIWIYQVKDGTYRGVPTFMTTQEPWSWDGVPPNGQTLSGMGDEFPTTATDGQFFLRTDFDTPRLFMKDGNIWKLMEIDFRKVWTPYNKALDQFIDNENTDTLQDGTTIKTKKAISKVVKPKINLHKNKEDEIKNSNGGKIK